MFRGIRAELKGCRGLPDGQRALVEADVVERLTRDLKMRGLTPGDAYAHWVDCQPRTASLTLDELAACMRWESVRDRAVCASLEGVPGDPGCEPFFLFHLE